MKRWALLLGILLIFSAAASAQDENPKAEVFAGYSYVRANLGHGIPGINMNGGSASFSYNPTPSIGLVADFGGYHVSNIGGLPVGGNVYTYLFGPKFAYRSGKWTPFVQGLFGGAHASGELPLGPILIIGTRVRPQQLTDGALSVSENAFAMALGGGLDYNATSHIGIRLVQAEYLMTRFASETQNNARISAGVVFRW
ncbi:MAG: porin family protein [Acidobacteriia bacterium]|nr:porin family protein [Terriglobia bacterium]